ncbi:alpha/beta fold hydrolase [Brevibacterium sp. Re57]|uniref:Alpha/beta fold hydrolase n=2 Tax=Brevibacterium gallinarum TaxID=2762220 RepID=A0ABR8WVQ4_9MICO|nr:alpha/beta fold hydrolase [Brevibacterium gallinarum]
MVAAAAVACIAAGGLSPLTSPAPAQAATDVPDVAKLAGKLSEQKLTWGECSDGSSEKSATTECAMVEVPRDWKDPENGKTWKFEVSYNKLNDTKDSRYKGIIMGNPGGPGGEGLWMANHLAKALPDLNPYYNFVGFNPRGIDRESRATCEYSVDPNDKSPFAEVKAIGRDCAGDPDVKTISTEQTTYDMDFVRHLLGEEKLNFFGYSYGTWMGTWYSNVFHSKAGLMTLDSALDTTQATYQHDKEFEPWAFERKRELWNEPYYKRLTSKEGVTEESTNEEEAPPAADASEKEQESFLKEEEKASSSIVSETAGEQLDDLRKLKSLASQQDSVDKKKTLTDMSYMVRCNDGQYTQGEEYWKKWTEKVKKEIGEKNPYFLPAVQCLNWKTQTKMAKADPETYPQTIVIQAELDANTVWEHGRATGVGLPNTRFIAVDNEGAHGIFPYGTEEVDRKVVNFYMKGKLPKKDISVAQGKPRPGEDVTYEYWKPLNKKANHYGELVSDPWQKAGTPTIVPVPVEGAEVVRSAEMNAAFRAWVANNYGEAGLDLIS